MLDLDFKFHVTLQEYNGFHLSLGSQYIFRVHVLYGSQVKLGVHTYSGSALLYRASVYIWLAFFLVGFN